MNLEVVETKGIHLVRILDGRFDALSALDFRTRMAALASGGATRFLLDLSAVSFVDSAGLSALLALVKSLPPGGDVRICGVRDPVRNVLRITRLDKILALHATADEALAALEARP